MIKVGIIGATGYAGVELCRIILNHPQATLCAVGSVSFEGKKISDVYPALNGICDLVCEESDAVIEKSDVVFACVQHGLSQEFAKKCADKNIAFIDLGADFRLDSEDDYEQWYGLKFTNPDLHNMAVYGLPELFREDIKATKIIANPGCYPTSIALGLSPALKSRLVKTDGIVIDSKSGVSGSGRNPSETSHFPNCNEAFSPYKIAAHRHTPEIEQTLSRVSGKEITVLFVPHLLPINRGIISTIYAKLEDGVSKLDIRKAYKSAYDNEKFVRLQKDGGVANLRNVKCSNFCDISLHIDERTNTLVVVSAIDNMVKGAAGQAVQNMNLIFGIAEDSGLCLVPTAF
ncbi:MAG: N-acetyl-gamma-glutamyl-phosphate reductase [Oscillospiraceae bacterium]